MSNSAYSIVNIKDDLSCCAQAYLTVIFRVRDNGEMPKIE